MAVILGVLMLDRATSTIKGRLVVGQGVGKMGGSTEWWVRVSGGTLGGGYKAVIGFNYSLIPAI